MSVLTKVLAEEIRKIEETKFAEAYVFPHRLTHHLMPPAGWLNDPNGLCYYKGRYHVFFQYSPFEVKGGLKFWGHYSSEDLVSWIYEGVSLYPDSPMDCHGVYSGSALAGDDAMHLFYTGNVKLDGDYDYINNGRITSTLHVESTDGIHFGVKEEVIPAAQYPEDYTCHIRDPKVWKEQNQYHMVLGGRKKNDQGAVLFYRSRDLKKWEFDGELTTEKPFGYMWECPDVFKMGGETILSVSPQGVRREEYRHQNIYLSGYFVMKEGKVREKDFCEWDMGFDFYAPQTFLDQKGRRILIGWMGMPDADEEYQNCTLEEGWQHCLTVPRELKYQNGKIYQYPVEELMNLRRWEKKLSQEDIEVETEGAFDLELQLEKGPVKVVLTDVFTLEHRDGILTLTMDGEAGAGRRNRNACVEQVKDIRILADTSAVEIYVNQGEVVFSSRFYGKTRAHMLKVEAEKFRGGLWKLEKMKVTKA